MKTLTLTQPWAQLVADGHKRVETRDWPCPNWQIGEWLAIHAGRSFGGLEGTPWPATANGLRQACHADPYYDALVDSGYAMTAQLGLIGDRPQIDMLQIPLGAVVAIAVVLDCIPTDTAGPALESAAIDDVRWARELEFGNYQPGRFAWKLGHVRKLTFPVPCPGERKLWDLPTAVARSVTEQVG